MRGGPRYGAGAPTRPTRRASIRRWRAYSTTETRGLAPGGRAAGTGAVFVQGDLVRSPGLEHRGDDPPALLRDIAQHRQGRVAAEHPGEDLAVRREVAFGQLD